MSDRTAKEHAEELHKKLSDDYDIDISLLEERLGDFYEYNVYGETAEDTVLQNLSDEYDTTVADLLGETQETQDVTLDEIDSSDMWITTEVKVLELWKPNHDSIDQVGLIGDETDVVKFVKWEDAPETQLVEDSVYVLDTAVTEIYEDDPQVILNKAVSISESDSEIDVPSDSEPSEKTENTQITGWCLVDIYDSEGLIKRCSVCDRKLKNNRCSEHGDVEFDLDLRIRGVIDKDSTTEQIIINRPEVERMADMSLEDAEELARNNLNKNAVLKQLKRELVPSYWTFEVFETEYGYICTDIKSPEIADTVSHAREQKLSDLAQLLERESTDQQR